MQKSADFEGKEAEYRKIVTAYLNLVALGEFEEGLRYFSEDCVTHNPYVKGTMRNIADAQISASKGMSMQNAEFAVKNLLSNRDTVAAHTELLFNKASPEEGGLRQVHIFRFKGNKIVEYWDVTQMINKDMPNAAGAFTASV